MKNKVPGKGNTDTVPAMLTPGEFVIPKHAVMHYGEKFLNGMIDKAKKFAKGGIVRADDDDFPTNPANVDSGSKGRVFTAADLKEAPSASGPTVGVRQARNYSTESAPESVVIGKNPRNSAGRYRYNKGGKVESFRDKVTGGCR